MDIKVVLDSIDIIILMGIFYRMGLFTTELKNVKMRIEKLEKAIDEKVAQYARSNTTLSFF